MISDASSFRGCHAFGFLFLLSLYLALWMFCQHINNTGLYLLLLRLLLLLLLLKGKAVPLQAWSDPQSSRKLRLPDFMTTALDGGKVVSVTHRPPLPQRNAPGNHFC